MASSQRFRALPDVQSIKDPATRSAYEAIKEDLEVLLGLSGDSNLAYVSKGSLGGTPTEPEEPQEYVPGTGEPPILPIPVITEEDIHAAGFYDWIMLSWDISYDYWLAHFEIFRAMVNDLTQAIPVGTTLDHVWIDRDVSPGQDYYYWIRIVQKERAGGNVGTLPTDGKLARCLDSPEWILEQLIGNITESHLCQALSDRIDLIDADATFPGSVNARIAEESGARALADNAMSARVSVIEDGIQANAQQIVYLASLIDDISGGGEYGAEAFMALEARVTDVEGVVETQTSSITALESRISDAELELAGLSGDIDAWATAISQMQTTVTEHGNTLSALSSQTTQIATTVGEHTTAIEQNALSIDGIEGEYTIKIDANGKVAGIGLVNGPTGSEFAIRADKFYIVYPEGDGSVSIIPFIIGMVNGTSTVGINGALIVDGTILARMIAANQITAEHINVVNLAAISADLGSITAGQINIGSGVFRVYSTGQAYFGNCDLQSTNYQAGVSGWRLTRTGQIFLTNLQCVAAQNIADGAVTGPKIGEAAVTTLKIGANQVTVPVYAYNNANHVFYSKATWMTTIGAILDPQSQPVLVTASCFFSVGATGSAASRSIYVGYRVRNVTKKITLKEEANMLYVPPNWTGVYFQPTCYAHDTAPASGNNSYSLDVLIDDGTWLVNTSGSSLVSRRHISCVGYKR
ncbi:MAG TPA: hypothetical protein PLT33_11860 [Deltaproteobacteria bacterium]|nr:hypothetical protein [Deltaproteobacteria bacterium]